MPTASKGSVCVSIIKASDREEDSTKQSQGLFIGKSALIQRISLVTQLSRELQPCQESVALCSIGAEINTDPDISRHLLAPTGIYNL